MKTLMIAGLCAGLTAAPLAVRAADVVLYDQVGQPVAVLVPVATPSILADRVGFPVADLFAEQDAMLRRMMVDMQAAADPAAGIRPGSTVMVSSFSDGRTSCSRTVTYQMRTGAAPLINVSQTGDGCGPASAPAAQATTPAAEPAAPVPQAPGGTRLYQIDYRQPNSTTATHRG